jgi:hypothetical protein
MYENEANAQLFLSKWEFVHVNVIRAIELIMQIFRRSTKGGSWLRIVGRDKKIKVPLALESRYGL